MKLAVVTGVSSGIGYAISLRLLSLGYKVIGISRNITQAHFNNSNFSCIQADLSQEDSTLQLDRKSVV